MRGMCPAIDVIVCLLDMVVVERAARAGPGGAVVLAGLCRAGEECNPCSEQLAANRTWGEVACSVLYGAALHCTAQGVGRGGKLDGSG